MRHWHEDRIIQPRHSHPFGGVDHGAKGHVLIELRRGNEVHRRLVWIAGCSSSNGVRGFGRSYHPARLCLSNSNGYAAAYPELYGGRLTRERLASVSAIIDREFGTGATVLIDLRRTLIIIEDPSLADRPNTLPGPANS